MAKTLVKVRRKAIELPALFAPDRSAAKRFLEFFAAYIRNPNTRRAYARAAVDFASWCEQNGIGELRDIEPIHVAAYIESLQGHLSAPSVKQALAASRMLFDWLVVGQLLAVNPASPVRGPRYSVKKGKTAVLSAEEDGLHRLAFALDDKVLRKGTKDLNRTIQRMRLIVLIAVTTGMRASEIFGLCWSDVMYEEGLLAVRAKLKGGKMRYVPMLLGIVNELKQFPVVEEDDRIFPPRRGALGVRRRWKRASKICSKELTFGNSAFMISVTPSHPGT